ncbi:GIY-YIG nuclease family protein [Paenibacillus thermotolerans]|uniref:GIY-YIG nuclease family protein n=1 Tax=Paenibacillus thermotolerans TaxID=3027807 RepID=UPI002368B75A|nr:MULTISPECIES: GIY-YIG nuclease family protein [unclassified Paenibacillus]
MTIDKQRKKELATAYKSTFRPMGVFQIRNTESGKIYVDCTMDLDGARNRFAFSKQMNMITYSELQSDWKKYGGSSFVFEELDRIKPREETMNDVSELKEYRDEVEALLGLWLEKLQPFGERGYNRPKR